MDKPEGELAVFKLPVSPLADSYVGNGSIRDTIHKRQLDPERVIMIATLFAKAFKSNIDLLCVYDAT